MALMRYRVNLDGIGGLPGLATHYFSGDPDGADLANARTKIINFWTAIEAGMSSGVTWTVQQDVAILTLATGDLEGIRTIATASGTGNETGEILPTHVQAVVRWRTSTVVNGRLLQGRTFIPGMVESNNPPGLSPRPSGTLPAAVTAAVAAMLAAGSPPLQVYQRDQPPSPPFEGAIASVTSGSLMPGWSVLRSRRTT